MQNEIGKHFSQYNSQYSFSFLVVKVLRTKTLMPKSKYERSLQLKIVLFRIQFILILCSDLIAKIYKATNFSKIR